MLSYAFESTADGFLCEIVYLSVGKKTPDPIRYAKRRSNWSEDKKPNGRWRSFDYDDIIKCDRTNLDIFWLKDDSLEERENLPDPEILAQEIVDDLQTALESFASIAAELK